MYRDSQAARKIDWKMKALEEEDENMACLTEEGKVAESRNPSCPEPSSLCFWVPSPDIPIHVLMNLEHCLIGIQTLCEAENVKVIHTPDSIWHQSKLECDSPSLSYLPIVL